MHDTPILGAVDIQEGKSSFKCNSLYSYGTHPKKLTGTSHTVLYIYHFIVDITVFAYHSMIIAHTNSLSKLTF